MLLDEICMPYKLLKQTADESSCDWGLPIQKLVTSIAHLKMDHVILPEPGQDGQVIFVVTADTVSQDYEGNNFGKPVDLQDAYRMVRILRNGSLVGTGFCVAKFCVKNGAWVKIDYRQGYAQARCKFDVPEAFLETYFKQHPVSLRAAGGMAVEQFGLQFFKEINGSFTAIVGLPLYELRAALTELGFYDEFL